MSGPALSRVDKLAESGNGGARNLATYRVGEEVGLMNNQLSARAVVQSYMEGCAVAISHLSNLLRGEHDPE